MALTDTGGPSPPTSMNVLANPLSVSGEGPEGTDNVMTVDDNPFGE